MYNASDETLERLRNLSIVGVAVSEMSNDNLGSTNQLVAKDALKNFLEGIHNIENVDTSTRQGIELLVGYLEKKLDKRMKALADDYDKGIDDYA